MGVKKNRRLHIIGAGNAGRSLACEVKEKPVLGEVAAFLDDDPSLIGKEIEGIPVLGPVRHVAKLLRRKAGDEAVIAMPQADVEYIKELYGILKAAGFERIRILPGISQIIDGDVHLIQTRSVDPQDLLGRTPVAVNLRESLAYLRDKRVLVTGAGGSIGSELCRQLLSGGVERLYLFGHGENSIFQIDRELQILQDEGVGEKTTIVTVIGDLKDAGYINHIIKNLKADAIFHTAAYKHVPLMESNPVAVIENNVFGTQNLIRAARSNKVRRFVLISTDKAVEPVSVYGASKYLCEKLVRQTALELKNGEESPAFMVVRFGNVLGSRGSIVPLFQKQIEKGGPVSLTHPDMRRWFMTIPEACSLVLKAGGVGENGGLYLLDMGEPVRIRDMAEQMIRFYGYEPEVDIKIEYIGLRPGEKLDEKLFAADELPVKTKFKKINRIERRSASVDAAGAAAQPADLDGLLEKLAPVCSFDAAKPELYRNSAYLRAALKEAIPSMLN
ncbi:MAG: polysaccharide biosynthesis protein [Spirochaetaceae bacterium]|jgi:FlaA1/EpsC-like NDP-sugar epimerase|nr:polysaccharide biosynthesis protein [Spirochaetaceae bacterium]